MVLHDYKFRYRRKKNSTAANTELTYVAIGNRQLWMLN